MQAPKSSDDTLRRVVEITGSIPPFALPSFATLMSDDQTEVEALAEEMSRIRDGLSAAQLVVERQMDELRTMGTLAAEARKAKAQVVELQSELQQAQSAAATARGDAASLRAMNEQQVAQIARLKLELEEANQRADNAEAELTVPVPPESESADVTAAVGAQSEVGDGSVAEQTVLPEEQLAEQLIQTEARGLENLVTKEPEQLSDGTGGEAGAVVELREAQAAHGE
jgi:chromosome segregation ATPase